MPGVIRGQPDYLDIKRTLRSNMTGPEARLWSRLRARQLQRLKFRQQHGIGPYIVDFYCPEQSLIIDVDGDSHADADQVMKDKQREQYLQSLGLRVIRYIKDGIVKNLGGVLEDLAERISSRSTSPRPSLPRRGKEADGWPLLVFVHHFQHSTAIAFCLLSADTWNLHEGSGCHGLVPGNGL